MKYRKLISYRHTLVVLAFTLGVGLFIPIFALPNSATDSGNSSKAQLLKSPKTAGVVLRTDDAGKIERTAREQGVRVLNISSLPSGESLVTLEESLASPGLQLVQLKSADALTAKAMPNHAYKVALTPNDIRFSDQWNLHKIGAPAAWDISTGSSDTTIAVIDTGVLFEQSWDGSIDCPTTNPCSQPDFPPESKRWTNSGEIGTTADGDVCWDPIAGPEDKRFNDCDDDENGFDDDWQGWDFMGGWRGDSTVCPNFNSPSTFEQTSGDYDFISQDNDPQPYSCDDPTDPTQLNRNHYDGDCGFGVGACFISHGTAVASVAAAATDNGQLIAGIDHNAKVMNLRVLDGYGFGDSARVTAAVEYATAMGADVINLSLAVYDSQDNCTTTDTLLNQALASAKDAGIIVVAAAGNSGSEGVCFPAKSSHVIAVGATNQSDQRASFSSYGPELDVMAPGVNIPAAIVPAKVNNYNNYTTAASGTSLATPHVAGLAGLIRATLPESSPDTVRHGIANHASKVPHMQGFDFTQQYGFGVINTYDSLWDIATRHPDGTLVKSSTSAAVYFIENGELRTIPSPGVFRSNRFGWDRIKTATIADLELAGGASMEFGEGSLVKGSSSAVYIIDISQSGSVQKRAFGSWAAFRGLGYKSSEIINVSNSQLPAANGATISDVTNHPDGTLVKSASSAAVYFIEDGALRTIPSPGVFRSNRFGWDRIKTATLVDLSLPTGAEMEFGEGSLLKGSSSTIYIVDTAGDGSVQKRAFGSWAAFRGLGYKSSEIINVSNSQLPVANGATITK